MRRRKKGEKKKKHSLRYGATRTSFLRQITIALDAAYPMHLNYMYPMVLHTNTKSNRKTHLAKRKVLKTDVIQSIIQFYRYNRLKQRVANNNSRPRKTVFKQGLRSSIRYELTSASQRKRLVRLCSVVQQVPSGAAAAVTATVGP